MPFLEFRRVLLDRKSTRLKSSHGSISYAVFCLKKKTSSGRHLAAARLHTPRSVTREHAASTRRRTQAAVTLSCVASLSSISVMFFFFFNDTATTEIYTLSLRRSSDLTSRGVLCATLYCSYSLCCCSLLCMQTDRKSTRLNSSHGSISYAVSLVRK